MIKLKVFSEYDRMAYDRKLFLEGTVNQWIKDNPNINILSTNMTSTEENNLTYSILYEITEKVKRRSLEDDMRNEEENK